MIRVWRRWRARKFNARAYWRARFAAHPGNWKAVGDRRLAQEHIRAAACEKNTRLARVLQQQFPDLAGKRVLDAGCGYGQFTEFARALGARAVGVDFSPAAVREARRRFPRAEFQVADLAEVDRFECFDAVVCLDTLINVVDDQAWRGILAALARSLAPQGVIIVLEKLLHDGEALQPPVHVCFRSLEEYRHACAAAGLRVERHEWVYICNQDLWEDVLVIRRCD